MAVTNLEETVPSELVSLPGAPVSTVLGDIDGFVYPDITKYYDRYAPNIGSTTGLGVAGKNPDIMVRVGSDIYLSENAGGTWTKINKPSTATNGWCAVDANGNCIVVTLSGSHPYYTFDKGKKWTEMPGISNNDVRFFADYEKGNVFYANVSSNLRTYTYNETAGIFEYTSVPLSGAYNNRLTVVPGIAGEIWFPRNTGGLGRITDAHTGNPKITTIPLDTVTCVGVGKAAPNRTYPSLYIWGKPKNTDPTGLYRSDDEGANWVRINDDEHQYGGPGNAQFVKGDMNVYGRVYMSTVGRGIIYGELKTDETSLLAINKMTKTKISKTNAGITIETPGICPYKIYSVSGILIEKNTCYQTQTIRRALTPGVYILSVETSEGIETIKFVK